MLRAMGQVDVFEIPLRRVRMWTLMAGAGLVCAAASLFTERSPDLRLDLVVALPMALVGCALLRGTFGRRLPKLRATCDGLWFGGGAIVPWHEVAAIYPGQPFQHRGRTTQSSRIFIAFRRRRTVLRVPNRLWFSSPSLAEVSLDAGEWSSAAVVAQLEAFRIAACGHENGVLPGASEVPAARVVVRS